MQISIAILVGKCTSGISYVKKLIKSFKVRVSSYPNSVFEAEVCLDATLTDLNDIGLLSETSLVITPNAYNEGVLYDVIPNTPLGDMTVVRATTATRVNSQGLVEILPRNVLRNSNNFIGTGWLTNSINVTVNSNVAISPNGKLDASKITTTTVGSDGIYQAIEGVVNSSYVRSIYIKSVSGNNETVRINDPYNSPFDGVLLNINGDWNRYNYTAPLPGSYINGGIWINSIPTDGIYVYGAQMEQSSTATEYFPTTTRLNIPRIDYTNGSCPSILVEPQRTNLLTYSEQFNDASWTKFGGVVLANTQISPDGAINSDTLQGDGSSVQIIISQGKTLSAGQFTSSIFAKASTANFLELTFDNFVGASNISGIFDLSNGTTSSVGATIQSFNNGWYKCSLTATIVLGDVIGSLGFRIRPNASNIFYPNAAATNGQNVYLWGAQLEQGAYPTSYIPTVASTVTRNGDVTSRNNIYTNGFITSAGGTWFIELNNNIPLSRDASTASIGIDTNSGGLTNGFSIKSVGATVQRLTIVKIIGGIQSNLYTTLTDTVKIAIDWNGTTADVFVNGSKIIAATPFTITNMQFLFATAGDVVKNIKSMMLFPTPLTDEQCILLTGDTYDSYNEMATNLNYILQ